DPEAQRGESYLPAGDATSVPVRILIVEDRADARDSLGMLIRAWNHEVIYAANGPEGLDRAREDQPDVVLIDIGLPGFDGYQVARQIRSDGSTWARHVRLIAVTGYGQAADRARAIDAGFDVHVLKPVDPAVLRELVSAPVVSAQG
ncbi:MAG TPA: response regulator, partial [Usitatibacter sp.]|nr:response regulator [Usitatibacter sp.]